MALFPQPQIPQNNLLSQMQAIRQMMGGNPQAFAIQAMRNNPQLAQQFDQFMQTHKGMTPAQVLQQQGIDPSILGMNSTAQ